MSSIESAPASIPATSAVTFNPAFAPKYPVVPGAYQPGSRARFSPLGPSPGSVRQPTRDSCRPRSLTWTMIYGKAVFTRCPLDESNSHCRKSYFSRSKGHSLFKPPSPTLTPVDAGLSIVELGRPCCSNIESFVGLDVDARTVVGCALDDRTGEVQRRRFGFDQPEVVAWIAGRMFGAIGRRCALPSHPRPGDWVDS